MAKKGSRALPLGLVLAAVSVLAIVFGIFSLVSLVGSVFDATPQAVPGTFTEQLEPNEYLVSIEQTPGLVVEEVVVLGPDGAAVTLASGRSQTITRNSQEFAGEVVFDAATEGTYTITVTTNGPTEAVVTRSLTGLSGSDALGFISLSLGVLGLIAGFILVIIGLVRRRKGGDDTPANTQGGWQPPASPSSYGQPNPGIRYQGPTGGSEGEQNPYG